VEDLKDLLHTSLHSIVTLNDLVTSLTQKVADLTLSTAEMKVKIERREREVDQDISDLRTIEQKVVIVSSEEQPSEARCARVCAGTTGRGRTTWNDVTSHGVKLSVDISSCGFVKVPTVTTSVEGRTAHWKATGLAAVYSTTTNSFTMWVRGPYDNPTRGNAESWGWNVEWVAVGYVC
jgi:hypothetical protein